MTVCRASLRPRPGGLPVAAAVCADLLAEIDEALARLAGDQRRVTDSEAWHRYVDRLLDERLALEPAVS